MSAVPANFTFDQCRALQMALNEKTRSHLFVDGDIGEKTVVCLRSFQSQANLPVTGQYDERTAAVLGPFMDQKYLTAADFERAAGELVVEVAAIRAAVEVESAGPGFLPDGRVGILFERHKFYKYISEKKGPGVAKEMQSTHPNICNPERGGYGGGEKEWTRMAVAEAIDAECAAKSASWGMFQVMGFNYTLAGWNTALAFARDMQISERFHLKAFVGFIQSQPQLLKALRTRDWTNYAKLYNGSAYAENHYDTKLAVAYARWKQYYTQK